MRVYKNTTNFLSHSALEVPRKQIYSFLGNLFPSNTKCPIKKNPKKQRNSVKSSYCSNNLAHNKPKQQFKMRSESLLIYDSLKIVKFNFVGLLN